MYYFLGISLIFVFLLVLNLLLSLTASILWEILDKPTQHLSAQRRTQTIFALRILPLLFAFIIVFVFLLPSYLLFEPYFSQEKVTVKMAIPALISLLGFFAAIYRIFGTWRQTRRLIKDWLRYAEKISVEDVSLPVYRFNHPFPVIAVVGVFKPKLFIADQIFSTLSEEELAAAIKHEIGHLASYDNFKRILLRVCSDLLVFPAGRKLEQSWVENSEAAADEYAAKIHSETALNLASALIKITKIIPANSTPTMPLGAFLIEKKNIDINYRVRSLLKLSESMPKPTPAGFRVVSAICLSLIFVLTLGLATNRNFLFQLHLIREQIVAILQ